MWKKLITPETSSIHPGGQELTCRLLSYGSGGKALDMGCGAGTSSKLLLEQGYQVYGIDQDPDMLRTARIVCPKGTFRQADFSLLPFSDSFFDIVLCECVLSLSKDIKQQLTEVQRVLKTDGLLLWSDLCLKQELDSSRLLTCRQWKDTLEQAGFCSMNLEPAHLQWKAYAAQLLWSGADLSCFKNCLDAPPATVSYCWGVCQKNEIHF